MLASLSRAVVACLLLLSLGGCANYIFRSFDIDSGESLSLDAKQRLVLATYKGGKSGNRKIVCAEPSPDAFSATSASAAASTAFTFPTLLPGGQTGTTSGSGGIAAARSESAASIGLRTQTIQLLRDGLYRACEAYMNGAIDQHQYNIILLNIDKLMVTLLGIDAIGGTPKAPPVSIVAGAPHVSTAAGKDGSSASASVSGEPPTLPAIITPSDYQSHNRPRRRPGGGDSQYRAGGQLPYLDTGFVHFAVGFWRAAAQQPRASLGVGEL